jgi:polyisoprenyl-teichoic acid--peptidoglycan teichoic acid transferase
MTEVPSEPKRPWWRRRRLVALVAAAAVGLAGAGVAVAVTVRDRYQVPTADLFGSPPPTAPAPAAPSASVSPAPPAGADIAGPLNILLAGVDTRENIPGWEPKADSVLILHVSRSLDRAYLTSLPRDLLVDVPAFARSGFGGQRTKLTHAMSYGSRVPGTGRLDTAQGFQLLAATVSRYTGIARFDAGAVLNFRGLRDLVDAVGGVDLYVDQRVPSAHLRPDGRGRTAGRSSTGYVGPQKVYPQGMNHLNGWQALDFARQRYGIAGGDYARQRHHRQLVRALVAKVFTRDLVTNPVQLDRVLRALGRTLTFDGRGRKVTEFAYALRNLRAGSITLVGLPGRSVGSGGGYRGEQLDPVAGRYFAAVRGGTVDAFLRANPTLVNAASP